MKKFIAIALSVASLVATAEMALAPGTMKHKYIAPNDYVTTNAWMTVSNKVDAILGGYAKRTGETDTIDFRNTRTMVKTQLAPVGEDAVNFDMLVRYALKDDVESLTNSAAFTNAVLAVGLGIDTNSVAVLNEISSAFGGFPIEGTATTVGGLLAALAAAVAWLKRNKADKVTTNAAPAGSVALAADRVTVVDGSSGTAVSVTIPTVDGSEMRLCELLITGVASDGALAVTHPANCLLADGADATSAGANHFVYAEYQRDRWLVTKTVLTEEAS